MIDIETKDREEINLNSISHFVGSRKLYQDQLQRLPYRLCVQIAKSPSDVKSCETIADFTVTSLFCNAFTVIYLIWLHIAE